MPWEIIAGKIRSRLTVCFTFFGDLLWNFVLLCECSIDRGVENDLVMPTCDDCAEFIEECDEYDGQPDEMQEWARLRSRLLIDVSPYVVRV